MNGDRPTIRCSHCGLNQWLLTRAGKCRRCHQPLTPLPPVAPTPAPPVEEEEYEKPDLDWFPNRLLALRKLRGMSQRELANKMGVVRTWIVKFENGKVPMGPQLATCARLAQALDLPIVALIDFDDLLAWAAVLARVGTERHKLAVLAKAEDMAKATAPEPLSR